MHGSKLINIHSRITFTICFAICFLFVFTGVAKAAPTDTKGHWAEQIIADWINYGWVSGYEDGTFKPDKDISRVEFVTMVNRSLGLEKQTTVNYSDVLPTDRFIEEIAKGTFAGYISGYPDGTFKPLKKVSRQEAAAMIARVLKLNLNYQNVLTTIKDNGQIPQWSRNAIAAVISAGYMGGYSDKTFRPMAHITRAEALVTLNRVIKADKIYDKPGTYGPEEGIETINGSVTISVPNVILRNQVINGNLIITESVGEGDVTLKNVSVRGDTVIRGGGAHSINIEDSNMPNITIDKEGVRIVAKGHTTVKVVTLNSGAMIVEVSMSGEGIETVTLSKEIPVGATINLSGEFDTVNVETSQVNLEVTEGKIGTMNVLPTATDTKINLGNGSSVDKMVLDSSTQVEGVGNIGTAIVNVPDVDIKVPINNKLNNSTPSKDEEEVGDGKDSNNNENNNNDKDNENDDIFDIINALKESGSSPKEIFDFVKTQVGDNLIYIIDTFIDAGYSLADIYELVDAQGAYEFSEILAALKDTGFNPIELYHLLTTELGKGTDEASQLIYDLQYSADEFTAFILDIQNGDINTALLKLQKFGYTNFKIFKFLGQEGYTLDEIVAKLKEHSSSLGINVDDIYNVLIQEVEMSTTDALQLLKDAGFTAQELYTTIEGIVNGSLNEAIKTLKTIGYDIEEIYEVLKIQLDNNLSNILNVLIEAGYSTEELYNMLVNTVNKGQNEALQLLKSAQLSINDMYNMISSLVGDDITDILTLMKEIGYEPIELADMLHGTFEMTVQEIVDQLNSIGYDIPQLATVLQQVFNLGANEAINYLVDVLADLGINPTQALELLAQVLQDIYTLSPEEAIAILVANLDNLGIDLNQAIEVLAQVLQDVYDLSINEAIDILAQVLQDIPNLSINDAISILANVLADLGIDPTIALESLAQVLQEVYTLSPEAALAFLVDNLGNLGIDPTEALELLAQVLQKVYSEISANEAINYLVSILDDLGINPTQALELLAQVLQDVYHFSAEDAINILIDILDDLGIDPTQALESLALILQDVYNLSANNAISILLDILDKINLSSTKALESLVQVMKTVFSYSPSQVINMLLDHAYSAGDVIRSVVNVFGEAIANIGIIAQSLYDNGLSSVEIADIIVDFFNVGAETVAQILKNVGFDVTEVATTLKNRFAIGYEAIASLLEKSGFSTQEITVVLRNMFNLTAAEITRTLNSLGFPVDSIIAALKNAEYSLSEITLALKTELDKGMADIIFLFENIGSGAADVAEAIWEHFGTMDNSDLILLIKSMAAAQYLPSDIAKSVESIMPMMSSEHIARILKDANLTILQITEALKNGLGLATEQVTIALRNSGYLVNEIAAALRDAYNFTDTQVAAALKAAEYTASQVAEGIKSAFTSLSEDALKTVLAGVGFAQDAINSALDFIRDLFPW